MQRQSSGNLTSRAIPAEVLSRVGFRSLRLGKTGQQQAIAPGTPAALASRTDSRTPGWLLAMAPACAGYLSQLNSRWLATPEFDLPELQTLETVQQLLAVEPPALTGSSQMQLRLMQQIEKLECLQICLQDDASFCAAHPLLLEALESQLQLLMEMLQRARQLQHLERRLNEEYVQISQLLGETRQAAAPSPECHQQWNDKLRFQFVCLRDFDDRCSELEICGQPVSRLRALLKDYGNVVHQVSKVITGPQPLGRAC